MEGEYLAFSLGLQEVGREDHCNREEEMNE